MNPKNASNRMIDAMCATLNAVIRIALALFLALSLAANAAGPKSFATPDEAVDALLAALQADDDAALITIFGNEHVDLLISPDKAANSAVRGKAVTAMKTYRLLEPHGNGQLMLLIGDQAWPFPIPLVKHAERWHFATGEGVDELVNRRVGANELGAIAVLHAYVDAQHEYAARDRNGDGVLQYAQRLASRQGKRDGLYWPADAETGEEMSPFGPLVAESAAYLRGHHAGAPYRGYHFRILTRQGRSAAGGAYSYVINGRMIAGFAMVAYPARYGESGVMTFIVNHNGKVFEKDLGTSSTEAGAKLTTFDPDAGWHEVAQ